MKTTKHLAICMDHASARLFELVNGEITIKEIDAELNSKGTENSVKMSEKKMHNKDNRLESQYYKAIGKAVINYDDVLIFGPTQAKTELFNLLRSDHHFDKIIIEVKQADKLTEGQEKSFVAGYFSNRK